MVSEEVVSLVTGVIPTVLLVFKPMHICDRDSGSDRVDAATSLQEHTIRGSKDGGNKMNGAAYKESGAMIGQGLVRNQLLPNLVPIQPRIIYKLP